MNKEYLIQRINYYRFWLAFFVTIDATMTAWFFNKLENLNLVILFSFVIGVLSSTVLAYIMNIKIRKTLKRLGK